MDDSGQKLKLRILCIGAHPDDCEINVGGTARLWTLLGHCVGFISVTNGQTGHHLLPAATVAKRRAAEAQAAAEVLGTESQILPLSSGTLEPTVANRQLLISEIRKFKPDLVITHRPNDYHPDHRYTSQLVQDAAYLVTVPGNMPEVPALRKNPIIAYCQDNFQKPLPFAPDIVVNIDSVVEAKLDAMHCHVSQMYEWIPWNQRKEDLVPQDNHQRRKWLAEERQPHFSQVAERFRGKLIERYGKNIGATVKYAEAFEGCEYGSPLDNSAIKRIFGEM
jgi:N-acetylglucosamine malate deacetylase 1